MHVQLLELDFHTALSAVRFTDTNLSSRLSIVNEPLDRNSLCKPQVLDDGRSVYTCVICHKQFLSLSDINRHMDFHEGELCRHLLSVMETIKRHNYNSKCYSAVTVGLF